MPAPKLLRLAVALVLAAAPTSGAGTFRTWKNAEGSRTFEGAFVSLEDGQITLKLKDGSTSTFSVDKLSPEDRKFAEAENRKPKSDLRALMGTPGQAFDTLRFGMRRVDFDGALAKSAHARRVGGGDIEFFGQSVALGDFLARIDGRAYSFRPVFENDALVDLRLVGSPVDSGPAGAVRSRVAELKALAVLAFGDPAKSFDFPDLASLPPNAFGVTDTWNLPGGRVLSLAISRDEKEDALACAFRLTAE